MKQKYDFSWIDEVIKSWQPEFRKKENIRQLEYKSNWYGRKLIVIDRFYPSSKTCNSCGYINRDLTLKDREWICPECGVKHDRDYNAALNILHEGLKYL